jgi:hypothetical protein
MFSNRPEWKHIYVIQFKYIAVTLIVKVMYYNDPCGDRLEYSRRSPSSRRRRRKGNPVPGGITGPPWGT